MQFRCDIDNLFLKLLLLLVVSIYISDTNGQSAKYSNEFLSVGVGARSLGMSGAVVATVSDVTAGYWNPAGMANLEYDYDIGIMHAEYFAGIAKYDYLSGAFRLDTSSSLGLSVIRFGVDDIPNTTDLIDKDGNIDYDRISYFSAADYALLITYARSNFLERFDIGGNVKIIYRNIGKFASAWGFGIDAAIHYKKNKWDIGLVAKDITTTFNAWSFNEEELLVEIEDSVFNFAPEGSLELTMPRAILGLSRSVHLIEKLDLLAEINAVFTFDGKRNTLITGDPVSIDPVAGIELNYNGLIFLRVGIGNFQRITDFENTSMTFQPNFGIGIHYKGLSIDYALTDIGDQSVAIYSNIFSLKYAFDTKEKVKDYY